MKKYTLIKTIQLILMLAFLAVCGYVLFVDLELYHAIAQNRELQVVCWLLWGCFGISFVFMILDFFFTADVKREFRELDFAVHSDPVSGLANRNSCDAIIDRYVDKPLPKGIGCVMLELTNIHEINQKFSHTDGNTVIRDFSNILKMASVSLCFVGRNGGNRFLAIFEDSEQEQIEKFLERIDHKVADYNGENTEKPISYRYGVAFDEPEVRDITQLVALSARRITR